MAWAPLRPCPHPRCPHLVGAGRPCPDHRQQERDRPNVEIRRWYRTMRWRALRLVILRRDPVCVDCGELPSRHVDHRMPHRGDPRLFWDPANLQGLCAQCHARKTGRGE